MRSLVVWDSMGPKTIQGEIVVDRTWSYEDARKAGHARWTDISLIRVDDPQYPSCDYMLQVTARSMVYHGIGGCAKGVRIPVGNISEAVDAEMYDYLEPCKEAGCQPPDLDDLADSDQVMVEVNWYKLHKCSSATEVVETFARIPKKLAHSVLQAASQVSPEIAQAALAWRRV